MCVYGISLPKNTLLSFCKDFKVNYLILTIYFLVNVSVFAAGNGNPRQITSKNKNGEIASVEKIRHHPHGFGDYSIFEERHSQGLGSPLSGSDSGGISALAPFRREIEMDDPPPPPPPPIGSRTQEGSGIGVTVTERRSIEMDDPPPPPPPPIGSRTQEGSGIGVAVTERRSIEMDDPPPPPPPPIGSRTQEGSGIGVAVTEQRSIEMDDPPPPPPPPIGSRTQEGSGIGVAVTEQRSIEMDDPPPPPPPPIGSRTQMGTELALSPHPETPLREVSDTNDLHLNHSHWSEKPVSEKTAMITRWVEDGYGNLFALESRWIGHQANSEISEATWERALYLRKISESDSWQIYLGADQGQDVRLVLDEFDNLVIAGEFAGTLTLGETTLESVGWTDLFVARIDASGHAIWVRHLGSGGEDRVEAFLMDDHGDFTVSGFSRFAKNLGDGLYVKSQPRSFNVRYLETGELDHLEAF